MFELITLGAPDLRRSSGGSVATLLAQPKRFALLVYLRVAAPGGYVRRDALLALFWPESSEERARVALRQALLFLRRSLGADAVRTRGDEEVGIAAAHISCDVDQLHASLRAGDAMAVLSTFGGGFLPGVHVEEAPAVTQWIDDTRHALRTAVLDLAVRQAERLFVDGDVAGALALAQRAGGLDPLHEPRHRLALRAFDALGDRAGALAEHEAFVRRLRVALEVEPSPETRDLVRSITERDEVARAASGPRAARVLEDRVGEVVDTQGASTTGPAALPIPGSPWWRVRRNRVVAALFVAAGVVALMRPGWPAATARDGTAAGAGAPRVLVMPLDNSTGVDSLAPLGRMAADWITEGLSRVDGIEVVPGTAIIVVERALADSQAAADSADRRRQLLRETGATVVVSGAAYRTGATLHLQARVHDAASSRLLRPAVTVSVPLDSAMRGVDALRRTLVAGFAPMLDTATHFRRAMAPPSFEAYRDLVSGFEAFVTGDMSHAVAAWERSAAAGSEYPMAQLALAIARYNLGELDAARAALDELALRRADLGPVEQATYEMIDRMMRGDLPRAREAVRRAAAITPGSINDYMVAELDRRLGRPAEALAHLRALGPERGELRGWRPYWRELCWSLLMVGDARGALDAARQARLRYPDDAFMVVHEIRALAALGWWRPLDALLDSTSRAGGGPLESGIGLRYRLAADLVEPAVDTGLRVRWLARSEAWYRAQEAARRPAPFGIRLGLASALLSQGRVREARALIQEVDRVMPGRWEVWRLLGVAAALEGDSIEAARWQGMLARQGDALPEARRGTEWPELLLAQAQVAAQRGRLDEASVLLGSAYARGLSAGPEVADHPWLRSLRGRRGVGPPALRRSGG